MIYGSVEPGFEQVRDVFADVLKRQSAGAGAAVAVRLDGRWIVDLWGGPGWSRDSIVMPYSVTKPFAAVCVLLLVDRGLLELDAPMRRYWPEFTASATVRHVLSHQAGLVALDSPVPTETFYDWDRMCALLAAQEPSWQPGTAHGESALFYGHLLGELVRRTDGRTLGRFLAEEVCGPYALDFYIGLGPAERARAVDLTGLTPAYRAAALEGKPDLYRRAIGNPPGVQDPAVVNSAAWRAAEIPAVNGHGTARAAAGFYAVLPRLLSAGLLAEVATAQCSGKDEVLGTETTWGLGFGLDGDDYGMGGLGGSYAGSAAGYTFAFLTGHAGDFDRANDLENALRSVLGLGPIPG
ncbi:serine hydrolase domain-containing protein [Microbispora sp. H11081]|uniref:serine hydrolase domain-containing protein n=1 Tax=Microbispora sp. H11081 TaxID=2729107 RepID=UPI001B8CA50D|nr:serine hydrolase domain-containing protein [Microbispora sp. H11081]